MLIRWILWQVLRSTHIDYNYIDELQSKFQDIKFERTEKTKNRYTTDFSNKSTSNDLRIFIEIQIKRLLRSLLAPFLSKDAKSKLSCFSQEENKDKSKLYKFDDIQDLQEGKKYAIQNVGHATQLIRIPGFNILTDPVLTVCAGCFIQRKLTLTLKLMLS